MSKTSKGGIPNYEQARKHWSGSPISQPLLRTSSPDENAARIIVDFDEIMPLASICFFRRKG